MCKYFNLIKIARKNFFKNAQIISTHKHINFHKVKTYLFRCVEFPALQQHVYLPPTVRVHMSHVHYAEYLRTLTVLP